MTVEFTINTKTGLPCPQQPILRNTSLFLLVVNATADNFHCELLLPPHYFALRLQRRFDTMRRARDLKSSSQTYNRLAQACCHRPGSAVLLCSFDEQRNCDSTGTGRGKQPPCTRHPGLHLPSAGNYRMCRIFLGSLYRCSFDLLTLTGRVDELYWMERSYAARAHANNAHRPPHNNYDDI